MAKAISLISGGLDSILATKLILEQKIEVIGLTFILPFLPADGSLKMARETCKNFNIKCLVIDLSDSNEYYKVIEKPKYGYGKNLNPCIDCHLFMLKKAKRVMLKEQADFIITGDVLGERPMSQRKDILKVMDSQAGLSGRVLRPLSARCLEVTIAEEKGLVDRSRLLAIQGRSRKEQFLLADTYKLKHYPAPAGGCLLTEKHFCPKVKDLIDHKNLSPASIALLKLGRHYRLDKKTKLVVGRSESDNTILEEIWHAPDILLKTKSIAGPSAILSGKTTASNIKLAAEITASLAKTAKNIVVEYKREDEDAKESEVKPLDRAKRETMRI